MPIKVALGESLGRWYSQLGESRYLWTSAPEVAEFATRGLSRSIVWAPQLMVDKVEEILAIYRRWSATQLTPTNAYELPIITVALAQDWMPADRTYSRQLADAQWITFPQDPKARAFKMRLLSGEVRAQLAIVASQAATAEILASSFLGFIDGKEQVLRARYPFAGMEHEHPVQFFSPDQPTSRVDVDSPVVACLSVDFQLKVQIPIYLKPEDDEPNDGKGTDGDINDPHGYPVIVETTTEWTDIPPP